MNFQFDRNWVGATFFSLALLYPLYSNAQQGMGVGTNNPLEMLHVAGAIKVGTDINNNTAAPTGGAGTIRFRSGQFEGWDGSAWVPLGSNGDSDWAVNGNDQYSAVSGNVGIGTNTPTAKLDVDGVVKVTNPGASPNGSSFSISSPGADIGVSMIRGDGSGNAQYRWDMKIDNDNSFRFRDQNTTDRLILTSNGFLGLGTSSPAEEFHVVGSIRMADGNQAAGYIPISDANGTMTWTDPTTIGTADDGDWTVSGNNIFNSNSGNVGIGTNSPVSGFHISKTDGIQLNVAQNGGAIGGIYFREGYTNANNRHFHVGIVAYDHSSNGAGFGDGLVISGYDGIGFTTGNTNTTTLANVRMFIGQNGNVGVGTQTPQEKLHVDGSIRMVDGNQSAGYIPVSDANGTMTWTDPETISTANDGDWTISGNDQFSALSGNVGVGTTAPAKKMHVSGTVLASGNPSATAGIELLPMTSSGNGGGRIFFREDNGTDNFGFSMGFTGANAPNGILNWPANSFNISRHQGSATGEVVLSISRNNSNVGIGVASAADRLHVEGSIRMVDGNQAAGYIPVSDANGTMTWTDPETISTADDGDWTISGNDQFSALSGNVGVGTTAPAKKMHVSGTVLASGNPSATAGIELLPMTSSGNGGGRIFFREDNGTDNFGFSMGFTGANAPNGILNWPANSFNISRHQGSATGEVVLSISRNNSNVGIGVASAADRLHVSGSIRMEDGNQAVGYIPVSDANGTMTWTDPATVVGAEAWSKSGNAGTTSGTDFLGTTDNVDFRIRTNGIERITVENGTNTTATRVGIGTNTVSTQTAFQAGLEIAGNVPNLILNDQTGGEQDDFSIVNGGGVAELMNGTTSSTIMALGLAQYSNNVGVGTITPSDRLHVEGSIRMVDGNQAVGYIPVSDANGTMVWTDPATIATAADSDGDATNELQTLSISGNDITLSDGGGTVSFPIQTQLTDADDDTKIQVEETADEDIIRFDLAGTEYFTMVGPRLEIKNSGQSVFIGESAGLVDDLTNNNTFIGYESGMTNSTGYNNTAVGLFASRSTNARENTSLGAYALYSNQSGVRNTVIGTGAGQDIVGSRNTIVGSFAGNSATGSDNVFLGYLAGVNESGDHRLYIENSVSSAPLIYGEFDNDIVGINGSLGVGTQSPQDELHVEGAIRMVDGNQAAGYIPVSDVNGTMVWTDPTTITTADDGDWAVSGNDIYNANTGYVGVNTTTPSAELDVMGRIHATNPGSSPDGSNITLSSPGGDIGITLTRGDGSGNAQQRWDLKIENDNSLRFRSQNTDDHFTLTSTGNLGIGTTTPEDELHVEGSIRMVDGNQTVGDIPVSDANGTMTWTDRSNFVAYHKQAGVVSIGGSSTAYNNIAGLTSTTLNVQTGDVIVLRAEAVVRFTSGSGNDDFYMRVSYGNCATGTTEEKIIRFDEDGGHDNATTLNYMDVITAPCTGTLYFRFQIKHVGDDPWEAVDGIIVATKY